MNAPPAAHFRRATYAEWIILLTALHLAICVVLWVSGFLTSDLTPLEFWASTAGVAFLLVMSAAELAAAWKNTGFFEPGEPLFQAWRLITLASLFRLLGLILAHVVSRWYSDSGVGYTVSGPLQLTLLGVALWLVLRLYRKLDFDLRPRFTDVLALLTVALYAAFVLVVVASLAMFGEIQWSAQTVLGWATYPLLCAVLLEAVLLRRAALRMGGGLISRCWTAYAVAIILTALGDLGLWLHNYGLLTPLGTALSWLIWYPAAAAYALGPCWQYEAIRYAMERGASAVSGSLEFK